MDKPMIYLKGAGKRKTNVVWGSYDAIDQTATFNCEADEIVVKSMTFINSILYPCNKQNEESLPGAKIIDCKVVGNGTTYLGRPWRGFARVLFYNSTLTNVVVPEGWIVYGIYVESMDDLAFAEYACRGEGAKISGRTYWEKNMSKDEIRRLTSMSYIDEEGWMKNQPFNMLSS
ncbi:probable pectinesterase 29 [Tanacetum coccineum]